MTLDELQEVVNQWIEEHGGYFDVLTNMTILTEEVGELASVLARTDGQQVAKKGDSLDYEEEIGDILWVLVCIANLKDVNLSKTLHANYVKKCKRDSFRFKN